MSAQERYSNALVALRKASSAWADAARELNRCAQELDPRGVQGDDPAALAVFQQIVQEFGALAAFMPGMRQLFAAVCGLVR